MGISENTLTFEQKAFIWTPAEGMQSLEMLLETSGIDLTDWQLTEARAISDDGTSIIGRGINPLGGEEAWLARINQIPEPGSLLLLAIGTAALVTQRTLTQRRLTQYKTRSVSQ